LTSKFELTKEEENKEEVKDVMNKICDKVSKDESKKLILNKNKQK